MKWTEPSPATPTVLRPWPLCCPLHNARASALLRNEYACFLRYRTFPGPPPFPPCSLPRLFRSHPARLCLSAARAHLPFPLSFSCELVVNKTKNVSTWSHEGSSPSLTYLGESSASHVEGRPRSFSLSRSGHAKVRWYPSCLGWPRGIR